MRRIVSGVACGVLLALAWAVPAFAANWIIDRVLAVAAGEVVMSSDLRAARELGLVDPGNAPDPDRTILNRLIDRALMLDEVNRYAPPEPTGEAIDQAVSRVTGRFASDGDFKQALARAGLDERQLREMVRQDLRIRAYLAQRFVADTPEQETKAIDDWLAGLRRRSEIVDLYQGARR